MKLFLVLFTIFTINNVNIEVDDSFIDEIHSSYEQYLLLDEYTNIYYDVQLYVGQINNKIYYGIYFRNKDPNQYNIKLSYNDRLYLPNKTPRGDVLVFAADLSKAQNFSILFYNRNDFYQPNEHFKNIKTISLEEFNLLDGKITGEGKGAHQTKFKPEIIIETRLIVYLVLVLVLLVCSGIILVYYKKKKGMFNSDIKSKNVFNFKEFINSVSSSNIDYDKEQFNNKPEVENEQNGKVVNQTYLWYHYEEDKSDFNIKDHLKSLGFPTEYLLATVDEKNKIMLELMHLKDQKRITQDDYLDEISELWKK